MIYAVILFSITLFVYAISGYLLYTIPKVEAGPISGVSSTGLQRMSVRINSSFYKNYNGIKYKYRRFVIQGTCMKWRGIKPDEMIDVRIFNSIEEKATLTANNIVLIFLNDSSFRGYKIREISQLEGDDALTFYYDEEGNPIKSSKPHALKNIIGIVEGQSYQIKA